MPCPSNPKKSDERHRFCIDFQDLNARRKQDTYPIPNMDGIWDKLGRAKYISKIDLKNFEDRDCGSSKRCLSG